MVSASRRKKTRQAGKACFFGLQFYKTKKQALPPLGNITPGKPGTSVAEGSPQATSLSCFLQLPRKHLEPFCKGIFCHPHFSNTQPKQARRQKSPQPGLSRFLHNTII
jgi:hypothetical protein